MSHIITCISMLNDRNFSIFSQDENTIIGYNNNNENDKICIFLKISTKLNVDRIQEYIGMGKNLNILHLIIIYSESVTPVANKIILNSIDIELELFKINELLYNITHHTLVPKHIKLDSDYYLFIKQKFPKIPLIYKNDPICKYYNFKSGNILKIIRKNGSIAYRKVIGINKSL
jgi:DNA-directed RNA polymerase I, II, and III subunit RPABC1